MVDYRPNCILNKLVSLNTTLDFDQYCNICADDDVINFPSCPMDLSTEYWPFRFSVSLRKR